jgi:hypothetical protein
MWLQIPPTFASAEKEESRRKLCGSRSRQLCLRISSLKKNPAENYVAPDPANNLLISSGLMKSQLKTPKQVK